MRPKVHYLNTGPWPYYIGFTVEPEAFEREMKRLGRKGVEFFASTHANASTHFLVNEGTALAIVTMAKPSRHHSKEQYAALLAHEASHIVFAMRERLGDLGFEAEAYLVQQIVQEGLQIAWATGRSLRKEPRALSKVANISIAQATKAVRKYRENAA